MSAPRDPAPIFQQNRTTVGQAYNAWAEHYNKCVTCQPEGWFDPAVKALCDRGQQLFRAWTKLAHAGW